MPMDYTGQKFNNLTFIKKTTHKNIDNKYLWEVRCSYNKCNKIVLLIPNSVKRQKTCGCIREHEHQGKMARINEIYTCHYDDAGLTLELFAKLISMDCHYCGAKPSNKAKLYRNSKEVFFWNGLDRKINSLGHTPSNVVPCCWTCNRMKKNIDYYDFIDHMNRIADRHPVITA